MRLNIHQTAGLTMVCACMRLAQQRLRKGKGQLTLAQALGTAEQQRVRTLLRLQIIF